MRSDPRSRSQQQPEVLAQLRDGAVKWLDRPIRPRQYDSAFHDDEYVGRKRVEVGLRRERWLHVFETLPDRFNPSLKVTSNEGMSRSILRIDFESKAAQWASVAAVGRQNTVAVPCKDRKDARNRLFDRCKCRIDNHWSQKLDVALEH